ncbi:MAG: glycosyltransferase, partial [Oscillospiraceae bacterium]|nr:glycosyltransferase [Oscillospiraceae bacterium]
MDKKVLIIIPAYNESENIERVVDNLIENYPQYDYLVVNDGSVDNTVEICRKHHYNLLDLPINLGLSGGVQAGFKYGYSHNYEYVVQFD